MKIVKTLLAFQNEDWICVSIPVWKVPIPCKSVPVIKKTKFAIVAGYTCLEFVWPAYIQCTFNFVQKWQENAKSSDGKSHFGHEKNLENGEGI